MPLSKEQGLRSVFIILFLEERNAPAEGRPFPQARESCLECLFRKKGKGREFSHPLTCVLKDRKNECIFLFFSCFPVFFVLFLQCMKGNPQQFYPAEKLRQFRSDKLNPAGMDNQLRCLIAYKISDAPFIINNLPFL